MVIRARAFKYAKNDPRDGTTLSIMHRNSSLWRTCSGKHISSKLPRKILNLFWSWYALNEFRKQISTWTLNKATYQNQSVYSFTINWQLLFSTCLSKITEIFLRYSQAGEELKSEGNLMFSEKHQNTFASLNSIKFLISFQTLFLFLYNCSLKLITTSPQHGVKTLEVRSSLVMQATDTVWPTTKFSRLTFINDLHTTRRIWAWDCS